VGAKGFLVPVWCVFTGCANGGDEETFDDDAAKEVNGVDAGRAGMFDGTDELCPNAEPKEGAPETTGADKGVGP